LEDDKKTIKSVSKELLVSTRLLQGSLTPAVSSFYSFDDPIGVAGEVVIRCSVCSTTRKTWRTFRFREPLFLLRSFN
jgi:hypothetical protein